MSKEAYVTLATNDTYGLGALVLGRSLRRVATAKQTVVMITPDVSQKMKEELGHVFNLVVTVDLLDSGDVAHLALMKRPELGVTFTKLHAWKLVQFTKCVFLDADTLVVQNCDELFEKEELSAAPDPGWPDCFNSGVFVFVPSETTFKALMDFAVAHGSFDGGDQGLLNMFFREWATQDIRKHLSFIYNVVSSATYSYLPALKFFGSQVKIVHFLGSNKPWLRQSEGSTSTPYQRAWWTIFREDVAGRLSSEMIVARPLTGCRTPPTPPPRYQFKDPWATVKSERQCKNRQQDITTNSLNQESYQSPFRYIFEDHSYCSKPVYPFDAVLMDKVKNKSPTNLQSPTIIPKIYSLENDKAKYHNFASVSHDNLVTNISQPQRNCDLNHSQYNIQTENKISNNLNKQPSIKNKHEKTQNQFSLLNCQNSSCDKNSHNEVILGQNTCLESIDHTDFLSINDKNSLSIIEIDSGSHKSSSGIADSVIIDHQNISDRPNLFTDYKCCQNFSIENAMKYAKEILLLQNDQCSLKTSTDNKLEITKNLSGKHITNLINYRKKTNLEIETQSPTDIFCEISLDHDGEVISLESFGAPTEHYSNNCKFNGHIAMESNPGPQGSIEIGSVPLENLFSDENNLHSGSSDNGLKTSRKAIDTTEPKRGNHDRLYDHITAESHTIDSISLQSSSCDENCLHLGSDHNSLKTTDPTEHFSGKHDRFDDCIAAENNTVESTPLQSSSCNERREQIDAGIAGSLAGGVPEEWRREAWEAGDVDYLGRDSFDNIWKRICECVGITAQATSAPDSKPTEPAPAIQKPAETAPVLDKSVEPIGEKPGELTISAEKPVKAAPTSKTPTESAPAQEKSADIPTPEKEVATEKKVVEPTASEKLVESAPSAEKKTAEPLPLAEPVPVSKTVADPTPVAENPLESVPEVKPFESVPAAKPAESIPAAKLAESIPAAETLAEPLTTIEKTVRPTPATEKMPDPLPEAEKIAESVPADEKSIEPTPATGKPAEPQPVAEKSVEKLAEPLQTTEKSVETIQATEKPVEPLPAVEKPAEQLEKVLETVPVLEKKSKPAPVLTDPAPVTEKAVESVAEIHKDASPAPVVPTEPVVEKIAESTLPPVETPVPAAEVCPLKSTPPSETKKSPPEVPVQAVLPGESEPKSTPSEPLSESGVAPVCKKEPSTPTVIPPSGPSSPQPADVAPEVCKLQATPSQPATPPASSHQSADAPVPPKRKQGKNGKPGKGKK